MVTKMVAASSAEFTKKNFTKPNESNKQNEEIVYINHYMQVLYSKSCSLLKDETGNARWPNERNVKENSFKIDYH